MITLIIKSWATIIFIISQNSNYNYSFIAPSFWAGSLKNLFVPTTSGDTHLFSNTKMLGNISSFWAPNLARALTAPIAQVIKAELANKEISWSFFHFLAVFKCHIRDTSPGIKHYCNERGRCITAKCWQISSVWFHGVTASPPPFLSCPPTLPSILLQGLCCVKISTQNHSKPQPSKAEVFTHCISLTICHRTVSFPGLSLTCPDFFMLQDNPVVDEANVFGGVIGFGPFLAQEVEDTSSQHGEFTVLDEFAEVRQACLFALRVLLNNADDAVHNGSLVLKATLGSKGNGSAGKLKAC